MLDSQKAEAIGTHLLKTLPFETATKVKVFITSNQNVSASFLQATNQMYQDVVVISGVETRINDELYQVLYKSALMDPTAFVFPMGESCDGPDRINLFRANTVAFSKELVPTLQRMRPSSPHTFFDTLKAELYRHGEGRIVAHNQDKNPHKSESTSSTRYLGARPLLSVVVPTLDADSEKTNKLVASLKANTDDPFQIIIVDNGNAPQGYSAPVNTAIMACNTPYIAVINDDVQVLPHWWTWLKLALDAGDLVVFPTTIEATRYDFSAWCFAMTKQNLSKIAFSSDFFFDPELVIYFQDSDLLMRLRRLGQPPKHVPESYVSHRFSATLTTKDHDLSNWIQSVIASDRDIFVKRWGARALLEIGFPEEVLQGA